MLGRLLCRLGLHRWTQWTMWKEREYRLRRYYRECLRGDCGKREWR
jgi:hypothetical protein